MCLQHVMHNGTKKDICCALDFVALTHYVHGQVVIMSVVCGWNGMAPSISYLCLFLDVHASTYFRLTPNLSADQYEI